MQTSSDYQPLTWWKRVPIYVTTIFVALSVVGMFLTKIGSTANADVTGTFGFFTPVFIHGAVWQPVTAHFVDLPSFFYAFNVFFLYLAGIEVEKYLGRRRYLKVLATFMLTPAVVCLVWYYLGHSVYGFGGPGLVAIGLFIAFATLYPNLEMFGWVTLKWLAFAGLVLNSMVFLPKHDWIGLSMMLVECGVAFGTIQVVRQGGISEFTQWIPRPKPKFRVVRAEDLESSSTNDIQESIDPLLDKIARHGLNSLTAKERARLEKASKDLSKKR
ncbi:MAG: hypothetical protein QM796_01920 [Chthoniobacteraceae bacterium]